MLGNDDGLRPPPVEEVRVAFASILELDDVDPDADFFDLGGDSLGAAEVAAWLSRALGADLEAAEIFAGGATPKLIAAAAKRAAAGDIQQGLITIRPPQARAVGSLIWLVCDFGHMRYARRLAAHLDPAIAMSAIYLSDAFAGGLAAAAERYLDVINLAGGDTHPVVGGLCASASLAFEVARRAPRVGGAVLIEPYPLRNSLQTQLAWAASQLRWRSGGEVLAAAKRAAARRRIRHGRGSATAAERYDAITHNVHRQLDQSRPYRGPALLALGEGTEIKERWARKPWSSLLDNSHVHLELGVQHASIAEPEPLQAVAAGISLLMERLECLSPSKAPRGGTST